VLVKFFITVTKCLGQQVKEENIYFSSQLQKFQSIVLDSINSDPRSEGENHGGRNMWQKLLTIDGQEAEIEEITDQV
jgi:hypothetical protein